MSIENVIMEASTDPAEPNESLSTPELPEDVADEESSDDDEIDEDVDLDAEEEADQENADPQSSAIDAPVDEAGQESTTGPAAARARNPSCPLDLPFSVVRRIMKAAAPQKRFTPELISAFSRSGGTFGLYLLSACQEAAESSGKSTIRPVDVLSGLKSCGFPELADEVQVLLNIANVKPKKKSTKRKKN